MCVQYIGGYSVHRGCSVHWGNIMSTSGMLSTSEGTVPWVHWGGGIPWIHWGISWWMWGIPWVHWGMFSTSGDIMRALGDIMSTLGFSIEIERIYQVAPPHASWYPSDVVNIPQCTHDIPQVLNIPRCTEYPPIYWTYIIQGENFMDE